MNPDTAHGIASIVATAVGVGLAAIPAGPDTCVPVGAIVLLAIASPRDIWQITRKAAGLGEA